MKLLSIFKKKNKTNQVKTEVISKKSMSVISGGNRSESEINLLKTETKK